MQRFGLIGWPVAHSLSPPMQEAGFRALGLEASYELLPIDPAEVEAGIRDLVEAGFGGWNVTVPHKGAMAELVDVIDPSAEAAGSVNTVAVRDGKLHGWSTDGYGLEAALREVFRIEPKEHRLMFWGTGGAARAVAVHFAQLGSALVLVNRTKSKADDLAAAVKSVVPDADVIVVPMTQTAALVDAAANSGVLIQGTSIGLHDGDPLAIPEPVIAASSAVCDMIYRQTPVLQAATRLGIPNADGRGMLLHQGVRSLEIWTGAPHGPVEAMRAALDDAIDSRD